MKIDGLLICHEDRIVIDLVLFKAKLMQIGIAGASSIRKTFEKYYSKSQVDKFMLYNRHNRKATPEIIKMYKKVYEAESKLIK